MSVRPVWTQHAPLLCLSLVSVGPQAHRGPCRALLVHSRCPCFLSGSTCCLRCFRVLDWVLLHLLSVGGSLAKLGHVLSKDFTELDRKNLTGHTLEKSELRPSAPTVGPSGPASPFPGEEASQTGLAKGETLLLGPRGEGWVQALGGDFLGTLL